MEGTRVLEISAANIASLRAAAAVEDDSEDTRRVVNQGGSGHSNGEQDTHM